MKENAHNLDWRPASSIRLELDQSSIISLIAKAASLRSFYNGVLFKEDYCADEQWQTAIVLSKVGQSIFENIKSKLNGSVNENDILFGVFRIFYHHELLIDCEKTNLNLLVSILNNDLLSGRVMLPHRFGRLLYDKFNDEYGHDRTDHILADEAWQLLSGTPIGVYQVGSLISGPLGVCEVMHTRHIAPSLIIPLWHCSDTGCQSRHGVEMLRHDVVVERVIKCGREILLKEYGPPSEWGGELPDILGRNIPRQPYTYFNVCTLIADCIFESERKALLVTALAGEKGGELRAILSQPPRKKNLGQGTAESIALKLTPEEQLQLLWTMPNDHLVYMIDKCVSSSSIQLSLAEIRTSQNVPSTANPIPECELSALGIRCSGVEAMLDCWALIWEAYEGSNRVGELDWRLHNSTGAPAQSLLLDYLCKNDPARAINELVLASEPITKLVCVKIGCSLEDITDNRFVDRLLWKIGFDLPRFSELLPTLRRRLEFFNQELLSVGILKDERDRERVRSAGVNLFVSIEAFLDQLVSYIVWLLSSDHFVSTQFKYDEDSARKAVTKTIGDTIGDDDNGLAWTPDRTNTLGVSMAYLNATSKWVNDLPDKSRAFFVRITDDFPHFAEGGFRVFPFNHTALWADCDRGSLERFADGFKSIATKLSRSNLSGIRNGLDHHRREDSFPKLDEMLAFVSHFREAIDSADLGRYFPKEFWIDKSSKDRFGRGEFIFSDYQGRQHTFYGPAFFVGLPSVSIDRPAIIAPGMLLGAANSEIVFSIASKSVSSTYWGGYPRRRHIPNPHRNIQEKEMHDEDVVPAELLNSEVSLFSDGNSLSISSEDASLPASSTDR